jgi:hypothetical protein
LYSALNTKRRKSRINRWADHAAFMGEVMERDHLEALDLSAVLMKHYILNKKCVKDVDWNR